VDLVFVVDSSGSIGEENFKTVKKVLDKLIRHFSVSASYARIGIVQYATNARVIYTLGRSQRLGFHRLAKRVRSLFYTRGGTKTGKGLELAYKMLHRSKRRLDGKFLKHEQVLLIIYSLYISTVTCKVTGKSYRVEEGISFFSPLLFEHHTLFTIFYYLLINSTRPYIQGHSVTLLTIPTRLQSYFTYSTLSLFNCNTYSQYFFVFVCLISVLNYNIILIYKLFYKNPNTLLTNHQLNKSRRKVVHKKRKKHARKEKKKETKTETLSRG